MIKRSYRKGRNDLLFCLIENNISSKYNSCFPYLMMILLSCCRLRQLNYLSHDMDGIISSVLETLIVTL